MNSFTAADIAIALGKSKRAILTQLQGVRPTTRKIVSGNEAFAWAVVDLPQPMQNQLEQEAGARSCRNAESLLQNSSKKWEPSLPLSEIAQVHLDKAAKLQAALACSLQRQSDLNLTEGEFERLGVEDYKRIFGYDISPRHWRELFTRTLQRDCGLEQWQRLDIYLDEKLSRQASSQAASNMSFELATVQSGFSNPAAPTEREVEYLWLRALEAYQAAVDQNSNAKQVKRALIASMLQLSPFAGILPAALDKAFRRKLKRWMDSQQSAGALRDKRKENSGNYRGPEISDDDCNKITAYAVFNCGGRISQAWRELLERNQLSEEVLSYYQQNPSRKSYVPTRVRGLVQNNVRLLEDQHHGPRQAKLNGASIIRNWSTVGAGDWYQADDCTLPIYYFVPDESGWFTLMRGQFLLMIDLRTTRILGYALQSERNYNARVIRTLITRVADEHGLPRAGFYFERGIWMSSKILKGDTKAEPFSWNETEMGLREFGLKFIHAKLPRSKPVERVLGAMQNYMEGDPGYAGRDEIHDRYERFQKLKLQIASRKVHPADAGIYDLEQWNKRLGELCERYNSEIQNGKMTEGFSPDEAYSRFSDASNPQIKLDASCRYLLAHHKRPVRVSNNGITLRFGKQVYNYRDAQTGQFVGQTVLAWFNPETPEVLAFTDMLRKQAYSVARTQSVPAVDAPANLLGQEIARIEAHQSYARVLYRTLKNHYAPQFRPNFITPKIYRLGQEIERGRDNLTAKKRTEEAAIRTVQTKAREVGMPTQILTDSPDQARAGLELMQEARRNRQNKQETKL